MSWPVEGGNRGLYRGGVGRGAWSLERDDLSPKDNVSNARQEEALSGEGAQADP